MSLKKQIKEKMTSAMKAKRSDELGVLRLLWNAVRKKEIDEKIENLEDAQVEKVLQTLMKQGQESLTQAENAQRAEAVAELKAEISVYQSFLPERLSADELKSKIDAIVDQLKSSGALPEGPAAMGAVMKKSMAELGRYSDGKSIQQQVKASLGL